MAQRIINVGSSANKGDGDPIRTAFGKVNDNFTELYGKVTVLEGQIVLVQDVKGDVFSSDSSKAYDSATGTFYGKFVGDLKGTIAADDSTILVDSVAGKLNATTLTGALPAIDGSALTGVTTAFSNITSTPTTLAGYGITDAATLNNMAPTGAVDFTGATSVDFTGATISGLSIPAGYTDSDVDTHLNTGTAGAGEVLSWTGADYDWVEKGSSGPTVHAYHSSDQTVYSLANNSNQATKLQLDSTLWDTDNSWDTVNSKFQPTTAGYYNVTVNIQNGSNTSVGNIRVMIAKNGFGNFSPYGYVAGVDGLLVNGSMLVPMNGTTDYLEFYSYADSNYNTYTGDGGRTFVQATWVRGL